MQLSKGWGLGTGAYRQNHQQLTLHSRYSNVTLASCPTRLPDSLAVTDLHCFASLGSLLPVFRLLGRRARIAPIQTNNHITLGARDSNPEYQESRSYPRTIP
jgi:hypothetical protein